MKRTARLFLENKIGRRAFMARLGRAGVASAAASRMAGTLEAGTAPPNTEEDGRILRNKTGGELMAEFLLERDARYVFGLGGSEEVGFLDALVDRLELQYVQGLHEGSVMSMADGYARASGETPIVNLHSVAGAGYAFAPMVNAFKDRIPVVLTVGRQATNIRGSNAFLEAVNLHQFPKGLHTLDMGRDGGRDHSRRASPRVSSRQRAAGRTHVRHVLERSLGGAGRERPDRSALSLRAQSRRRTRPRARRPCRGCVARR